MHAMDATLQASMPTVMVPRFGALVPMPSAGERLLMAANGVFLEVCRPWVRLVRRIASFSVPTAIPYGVVEEATDLLCGKVPPALVREFAEMARRAMPKEVGAWIVWRAETGVFRLVPVQILEHSAGHLKYERPELRAGEYLVLDCHSHGRIPAFFSAEDNADDRFDVKLALVVGSCDRPNPSLALRLCAKGVLEEVERIPTAWRLAAALGAAATVEEGV
ncbi:hypothetical protein BKK81_33010 (plasmid) [Cupriavidus sp. USMAHM13]|uniref:PRTRC system protein A n=1 Tax=Cupriavidus sp. USMAHM13 TaxID=1389192 RepID=UPI0008A6D7E9|nr:PRTRC system protein A [Cupriavidus sp. USMAHM13]AOZ04218.1 hypothetical protein BKK81_33010 [Cupriavidus sp. USMAHM13]